MQKPSAEYGPRTALLLGGQCPNEDGEQPPAPQQQAEMNAIALASRMSEEHDQFFLGLVHSMIATSVQGLDDQDMLFRAKHGADAAIVKMIVDYAELAAREAFKRRGWTMQLANTAYPLASSRRQVAEAEIKS